MSSWGYGKENGKKTVQKTFRGRRQHRTLWSLEAVIRLILLRSPVGSPIGAAAVWDFFSFFCLFLFPLALFLQLFLSLPPLLELVDLIFLLYWEISVLVRLSARMLTLLRLFFHIDRTLSSQNNLLVVLCKIKFKIENYFPKNREMNENRLDHILVLILMFLMHGTCAPRWYWVGLIVVQVRDSPTPNKKTGEIYYRLKWQKFYNPFEYFKINTFNATCWESYRSQSNSLGFFLLILCCVLASAPSFKSIAISSDLDRLSNSRRNDIEANKQQLLTETLKMPTITHTYLLIIVLRIQNRSKKKADIEQKNHRIDGPWKIPNYTYFEARPR